MQAAQNSTRRIRASEATEDFLLTIDISPTQNLRYATMSCDFPWVEQFLGIERLKTLLQNEASTLSHSLLGIYQEFLAIDPQGKSIEHYAQEQTNDTPFIKTQKRAVFNTIK